MAIDAEARARLEKRMDDRRTELELTWRQVASLANITYEGLRGVRKGPSEIPALTRRKIERALQWPKYEIDRILDGDTPDDEQARWRRMTSDELKEEGRRREAAGGPAARIKFLEAVIAAREGRGASTEDSPR